MAYSSFSLRLWRPEDRTATATAAAAVDEEETDRGRTRGERTQAQRKHPSRSRAVQVETRDFRVQAVSTTMSVQSVGCGFHFLALWGDTEGEDGRLGLEGGQGSGRGEEQAVGLGGVQQCCSGSSDPGKQKCGSHLVQGFLFQFFFV